MQSVCRTGRPEFKRDMGRNTDAIKECLQFKGEPDPLRGDEIYRRVREMAKETLEAIFDSQAPVTTSAVAPRISGQGHIVAPVEPGAPGSSNLASQHGSSTWQAPPAAGASKYTGFGNPHMPTAAPEKSWIETAKDMADKAKQAVGQAFNNNDANRFDAAPLPGSMAGSSDGAVDYSYNHATNRGANAYGVDNRGYVPSTSVGGMVADSLTQGSYGGAGGANSDGSYEKQLIEDLCEPGGTKAVPPEDKLQSLLTSAPTLNEELLCPVLSEHLASDSWQSIVKALIVCASLAKTRGCEHHADWLAVNEGESIKGMTSDSKLSIRQQAMKTSRALSKFGVDVPASRINEGSGSNSVSTSVDLLDAGGESMIPPPPVPTTAAGVDIDILGGMSNLQATGAEASTGSLFEGMAVGPSTTQAPTQVLAASTSAFGFISQPAAIDQTVAVASTSMAPAPIKEDPFDFLDTDSSSSSSSSATPAVAVTSSSAGQLDLSSGAGGDMNSLLNAPPVPTSTVNDTGSVLNDFSSLNLNGSNSNGMMQMNMNMNMNGTNNMAAIDPQILAAQNAQLQMQMQQMQQQMMMQQQNMQQRQQSTLGGNMPIMVNNPMGLGTMGSFSTIRTSIPNADEAQQGAGAAGSGFSFLNSTSESKKGGGDSFSFVNDAMKASKK